MKTTRPIAFFFAMSIVVAPGCNTKGGDRALREGPVVERQVTFLLAGDASEPVVIARGVLELPASYRKELEFTGSWQIRDTGAGNVDDPKSEGFIAPLSGSGTLRGECKENQCLFELYPGIIDNNVEIMVPGDELPQEGRWQYVTDAGISASGAVRLGPEASQSSGR